MDELIEFIEGEVAGLNKALADLRVATTDEDRDALIVLIQDYGHALSAI